MSSNVHVSFDEALRLARHHRAAGNLITADRAYRDILESLGEDAEVLHEHGLVRSFRGDPHEAYTRIARALELAPDNPVYHSNFAAMAEGLGKRAEAVAAWRRALELKPDYVDARNNLAKVLIDEGVPEEAASHLREALTHAPDRADLTINLGLAHQASGNLDHAIATWEHALTVSPEHATALSNLATAYRETGRAAEAADMSERAVAANPRDAVAHNNHANSLLDRGDVDGAMAHFLNAIDLDARYVRAYDNMGVALQAQERYEEAARWHRFAIALDDAFAEAHHHLSTALREAGDIAGAETAANRAIVLDPDAVSYRISLAHMLLAADRADEAETILNQVVQQRPESANPTMKLAQALEQLNRFEEAEDTARTAIRLAPENPWTYRTLSSVRFMAGRVEQAAETAREALAVAPEFAPGYAWLANIHQVLGDTERAAANAREALARNPNAVGAFTTLTAVKKMTPEDDDLAAMERALAQTRNSSQRMTLQFALGKAYEDCGRTDDAFAAYKEANDLRRQRLVHDPDGVDGQVRLIRERYTPEHLAALEGAGDPSPVPVFIVGMPRSGTTLVEQILASHPEVHGAGELPLMGRLAAELGRPPTREDCARVGSTYVAGVREMAPEATRITDKMPGNYHQLGLIAGALPNAAIIHIRRDPVDTCWSCYKQNFARGQYWSYELGELGRQYRRYSELMAHWRRVLPGRFMEIDYEEVVADTETAARRLVAHAGLAWDDRCLAFHETDRPVMTASKAQVRQPIYRSSMQKWRRYEDHLQPLLAELGDLVPDRPGAATG